MSLRLSLVEFFETMCTLGKLDSDLVQGALGSSCAVTNNTLKILLAGVGLCEGRIHEVGGGMAEG